jgi:putative RNA 2'-phosphotransferase
MDYKQLSKTMAVALRHEPEAFGLKLNKEGWASLERLLAALRKRTAFAGVTREDIEAMMQASDKQRYEISGDKIRAHYGHSIPTKIEKPMQQPPEILFHGTQKTTMEAIQLDGLLPMTRQYVHLSADAKTAMATAGRRGKDIVVLRIRALDAFNDGVKFYLGNDSVWLAEAVPVKWIEF